MNPITDEAVEPDDSDDEPFEVIKKRFKDAEEYWSDDKEAALEDIKFRAGEQWLQDDLDKRKKDRRPALTVDKLNQYVRQVVNDGRQNRPAIKVRPVDGGADIATSEIYAGIVKHIEADSNADVAYDTALDSAATCGFGYFRVISEYAGDETFDQDLKIRRVRNPLSILIDPSCEEADASDMRYAFEIEDMDKEAFEAKYPNKIPADWETSDAQEWYGEKVRTAVYWEVREEDRTLYLMQDGSVITRARYDEIVAAGVELDSLVKEKRNIPIRKVYRSKVFGHGFLEEPSEWIGKYIPLCVVYGNEYDIEGKVSHSGLIRPAKDAQRLYNYSRSAFAERVALTPKAPWLAAEGQLEGREDEWETSNTETYAVLQYKPISVNGQQMPPPQRINPSDVPVGFQQDMQISEHDIQGAIGMYAASLGSPSNERSGKAIMARQREGDTGTFHYHDNLNRAIRHCGRILVDLIPKIYDSNRVVRIMGYDGATSEIVIDPSIPTASQKLGLKTIYNLGVGKYDVSITTGPSYNTLRQEAAESMVQMIQANPALMGIIGDLMVKNMDWPGAEEISKRLRMTLPPNILEAEQREKQDQLPPEAQQAIQALNAQMEERDIAIQRATEEIVRLRKEAEALKMDVESERLKAQQSEIDASQQLLQKDFQLASEKLSSEEKDVLLRITKEMANQQQPESGQSEQESKPELDIGQILQTIAAMQQPINITVPVTVDGKGQVVKQGRAVRQEDGSYLMESVETPTEV